MCVYVCACVCVCMCVSVRERESASVCTCVHVSQCVRTNARINTINISKLYMTYISFSLFVFGNGLSGKMH